MKPKTESTNTSTADCSFDIHRALNAHRSLDKICNELFFDTPRLQYQSHQEHFNSSARQDPFIIIRKTNEVCVSPYRQHDDEFVDPSCISQTISYFISLICSQPTQALQAALTAKLSHGALEMSGTHVESHNAESPTSRSLRFGTANTCQSTGMLACSTGVPDIGANAFCTMEVQPSASIEVALANQAPRFDAQTLGATSYATDSPYSLPVCKSIKRTPVLKVRQVKT
jgi:hypothetical protein